MTDQIIGYNRESTDIAIISGEREITFPELLQRIGLYSRKSPTKAGERTLIFSENREGWIYAFYSVWANHGIAVPVDASSTVSDVAYIINDCNPVCVWTSREKMEVMKAAVKETGKPLVIHLIDDYETAETDGKMAEITYKEEDTALIIYTSGTTGSPKGVMLSFQNILVNVRAVSEEVPIFTPDRRTLILLPLHHVLPLVGTVVMPLYVGGGVAICPSMSGPDIMDTMQRGQIAIMIGVPRLWLTLYAGIKKKIDASALTRGLFSLCTRVNSVAFSRFIFKAVHKKMGGHIKYLVSGGAALEREIALGLQTLGLELLEGYGMTEAAPMIAFTRPGDLVPNCVGKPLPAMECKILNGEVCAKGPNVMQGYYNRPHETASVIDKDGFLHTGDLGHFDDHGRLYLTGRSKEIIVLSNGKNVQPSEIEYKLEKYTKRVKETAVVQDGDMLRAIIVPQEEWARNLTDEEVEETLKREVLEPYNLTVTNYKKLMSLMVYRGELPRTRLEKLQRYKLKDILAIGTSTNRQEKAAEELEDPIFEEYHILKTYIEEEKQIQLHPTDHIETDLGFDSLDMVALQGFIQQTFGTDVNAADMPGFKNMLALAEHVAYSKTRMEVKIEDWHEFLNADMPGFKNIQAMAEHVAYSKTRMEVRIEDWHKFLNADSSGLELPHSNLGMSLLLKSSSLLFKVYNRLSFKGTENIPAHGPIIIAPNHQSYLDGALVSIGLPMKILRDCYFYATEEHVQGAFRQYYAHHNNIIIMERGNLRDSILKLAEALKRGKNVMIFPEGSRTRTGRLTDFKKTFAILSRELQVPILPVCIRGAFEALPRSRHFVSPHKIEVEFLTPVIPDSNLSYDEIANQVKQAIHKKMLDDTRG